MVKWLAQGHEVSNFLEPEHNLSTFSLQSCPISSLINLPFSKYTFKTEGNFHYCITTKTQNEHFKYPTYNPTALSFSPAVGLPSLLPHFTLTTQPYCARFAHNFQFNRHREYNLVAPYLNAIKPFKILTLLSWQYFFCFNSHDPHISDFLNLSD